MFVFVQVLLGWQLADRAAGYRASNSAVMFIVDLIPIFALNHASEMISAAGVGDFQLLSQVCFPFSLSPL